MREEALPVGRERDIIDVLKKLYTVMHEYRDVLKPVYERLMADMNQRN